MGTKMEMTIYDIYRDRFRGLEKQEGKRVEIFIVEVGRARSGFKVAKSKFILTATGDTQIHIIDPLNDQIYFEFKGIHEIPHMSYKERNFPIVFKTDAHFDDPEGPKMVLYIKDNMFNPRFTEVEEFRQSVNNNDPYVRKYGAIWPL
ncbi:unnamed protein product [Eruca vesicaria subsp. sativa]|uniref:Uncharacterized protein n=1 Tax=Eruca vesicaria subsp. sativa TaxID=29727 RepID=A0ABC8JIP9_ERUVS|nr:unnamed protein product [Eruca vesicaria subsp. sativa]